MREILAETREIQLTPPTGVKQARPRLTATTRAEIATQYAAGKSSLVLAKEYNIAKATVLGILREHRVVVRKQKSLTPDQVDRAAILYEEGQSLERIAKSFNVSAGTVHSRLRELGIAFRDTHGRPRV